MKYCAQLIGVLMICGQLAACGGGADPTGESLFVPDTTTSAPNLPTAAQSKALTDAFAAAQTLWTNTTPLNYHYNYKEGGVGYKFDAYSPVTIWVRGGLISQVTLGVQVLNVDDYPQASIEQIFIRMSYTMSHSQPDTHFFAEYDPVLGFPTQFRVTPNCCATATQLLVSDLQIDQ
jgi:Family of unknown function (DUF6174)